MRPAPEFHNRRLIGYALDALLWAAIGLLGIAPAIEFVRGIVWVAGE